jgi:hypothetical protein
MTGETVQILDPTNPRPGKKRSVPPVALKGARLAYLNNGWLSMTKIGRHIEGPLKSKFGVSEVVHFNVPRNMEPPGGLLDEVARDFDAAIVGMAN